MQWLTALDGNHRVISEAAQAPGVRARFGLTQADTDRSAWAVDERGRYAGAAAVFKAVSVALNVPWLYTIYRLWLVRFPAELAYAWIARHRHTLPGVAPYCSQGAPCGS